jgi:alkaline phosphatase D
LAAGAAAGCTTSGGPDDDALGATTTTEFPEVDLTASPFVLGVASGDPLPDAVVIWTRLMVPPGTGPSSLRWEVMTDEQTETVAHGAATARPEHGHSVHVDVSGLDPATTYRYRFMVGDHASEVGRTRTAPAPDDSPGGLRFAVASCQAFQTGWYSAYRHLSAEDLDVVFFVGDYIYELETSLEVRPHGLAPPQTLDEFRRFYEVNKADPDLQAAHGAFPWVMTWDDHEVEDNYANLEPGAVGRAMSDDADEAFPAKRAAAYQAWWEHAPVRLPPPESGALQIYRSFAFGDLAKAVVLDNRQYRTSIPTGEGAGNLPRGAGGGPQLPGALAEDATYLGAEQEAWVETELSGSSSIWNVIVQQTVIAEFDRAPADPDRGFSMDSWDGYVAARRRLLGFVNDNGIENLVSVGGDIHSSAVTDLQLDYGSAGSEVIGSEFVGPSITALEKLPDGFVESARTNPHVHFYDIERHGYLRCELTRDELRVDYRYVTAIDDPQADIETGSSWRVRAGSPGAAPT